jgi:hypothetical protein
MQCERNQHVKCPEEKLRREKSIDGRKGQCACLYNDHGKYGEESL